jgi:ABC-type amino acid transport substrate-binding protein
MHRVFLRWLFLLLALLLSTIQAATLKVSYDPEYAPFSYAIDHKPYGLFIDIWRYFGKTNHHNIVFVEAKSWDDALTLAKTGKVDFFLGTTPYQPWMHASQPYYQTATSFFTRTGFKQKITQVGIIGNDYRESLLAYDHTLHIQSYHNYSDLIKALLDKKVDAIYDDTIAISYFSIQNHYQHLLKKINRFHETSNVQAISAESANIDLFNQGYQHLKRERLLEIEKKWIYEKSERYYDTAQTLLTLPYAYDPDWRPFEWKDEMRQAHLGIISDILSVISKKTKINFVPVETDSWAASVQKVKSGEARMFSAIPYSKERASYLNFTKHSIYSYPAVLVSHKAYPFALNEHFEGKKIGIVRGNSLGEWIQKQYPKATFVPFKNIKEGFQAIENREIDFFGINGVTALYYINILGFSHAKVFTKMDYMFHLKIALRKDVSREILDTIDTALATISNKERNTIYHKWTSIKVQKELDIKLLSWILGSVVLIVLIFLLINRQLKKLVREKTRALQQLNESLEYKVEERTRALAKANQHMQDSITYASLIQNSILPDSQEMASFFADHFVIWEPKDIVGGDIYFFHRINETEALLFLIDCTGHGVSGAFVTMLAKAIESQITTKESAIASPGSLLGYFNRTLKHLLKQEQSHANVGMDAAIVFIDTKERKLTFSGANIALHYIEEKQIKTLAKNRYAIGYRQCDSTYTYREHTLSYLPHTSFYLSTDGYIDQNGGKKGFPMGRRRFHTSLLAYAHLPFPLQKEALLKELASYQGEEIRNDDITLIGFHLL